MLFMLKRVFAIDLRSLGLFRIALGLILLCDLAVRGTSFAGHYGYRGVLPPEILLKGLMPQAQFSLNLISSHWLTQTILFSAYALSSAAFLVGFKTRIANALAWIFLLSIQNRNPLVLQGGDELLRMMMCWALFLPMGARFSLDSVILPSNLQQPRTEVFSFASAAVLLQLAMVYLFSVVLKSGAEWVPDGTAVYFALNIEEFAKPIGLWIRQFPSLMKFITLSTWYFEAIGPVLLFVPVGFVFFRILCILGFVGLHVGLFLSLELGIFPFVSSSCMIPFLPAEVWDWLETSNLALLASVRLKLNKFHLFVKTKVKASDMATKRNTKTSIFGQVGAVFFLLYVFAWNMESIGVWGIRIPYSMVWISEFTRVDQYWNLFAPYPYKDDGWFVMPGQTVDGTAVDVFTGKVGEVSWEKPRLVSAMYPDDRWRSLLMNLRQEKYEKYFLYFGKYKCLSWNENSDRSYSQKLKSFQIFFMKKTTPPPGQLFAPLVKELFWEHDCF